MASAGRSLCSCIRVLKVEWSRPPHVWGVRVVIEGARRLRRWLAMERWWMLR